LNFTIVDYSTVADLSEKEKIVVSATSDNF